MSFRIVEATPDRAVVDADYINRSVYVDSVTKQDLPTNEPPSLFKLSFQMRKIDSVWKVVDGVGRE
jgi:hypothetical protein